MAYQSCLIYHFLVAALFWDVCFFLIFSLNYQQGVTQCCIHINKWEEITKSTLDQANVHHLKGLTSLYIISYLHFLNLNNILTLPKTLVVAKAGFGLSWIKFPCFLPARFTRMNASLRNHNKCKPSILYMQIYVYVAVSIARSLAE